MADCLLLGDSIALGLAVALKAGGIACDVAARVGARSAELPRQIAAMGARPVVVLSTGTNDAPNADLEANLIGARMALGRARIVWILPYRRQSAYAITRIAFRFGDDLIDIAALPSRDHIHPASYRALADMVRR
jgi:lysophospholipase L1-like esterase